MKRIEKRRNLIKEIGIKIRKGGDGQVNHSGRKDDNYIWRR